MINSNKLSKKEEEKLIRVLREHREAVGWISNNIKGISPFTCMHRILLEDDNKSIRQAQRCLKPSTMDVVKKEILKLLDIKVIYLISYSR